MYNHPMEFPLSILASIEMNTALEAELKEVYK